MFDYVLENVRVYDGTGLPGYTASVAISGEKISTVSRAPQRVEARVNVDGRGLALCLGFVDDVNRPNRHPRAYGAFPKIPGRYARDLKIINLEEAVMKLSTISHAKLGMSDRGIVREG